VFVSDCHEEDKPLAAIPAHRFPHPPTDMTVAPWPTHIEGSSEPVAVNTSMQPVAGLGQIVLAAPCTARLFTGT
jgi:hypothetical protein